MVTLGEPERIEEVEAGAGEASAAEPTSHTDPDITADQLVTVKQHTALNEASTEVEVGANFEDGGNSQGLIHTKDSTRDSTIQ